MLREAARRLLLLRGERRGVYEEPSQPLARQTPETPGFKGHFHSSEGNAAMLRAAGMFVIYSAARAVEYTTNHHSLSHAKPQRRLDSWNLPQQ